MADSLADCHALGQHQLQLSCCFQHLLAEEMQLQGLPGGLAGGWAEGLPGGWAGALVGVLAWGLAGGGEEKVTGGLPGWQVGGQVRSQWAVAQWLLACSHTSIYQDARWAQHYSAVIHPGHAHRPYGSNLCQ